ncbi:MAG TPA: AAA family ATPase, partial [Candidatus Hydrogenedentes bacterium]|nr:AAA family ATPase [Candidatus Hydrogenedentota bacterium]
MRLATLWLDGYGIFSGYELRLDGGLQVVVGPNEHGKTTLRNFIADMLYGQKRSTAQRLYDESNELRRPWINPKPYAGRLLYRLDDGSEFEVHRVFDRDDESVQVFDRTRACDVTSSFARLRNREPNFAETHLGLSKDVFLSTATISYLTLEELGDTGALAQIRERLLALADSGDEEGSAETALKRISTRIASIGQAGARTRPLPLARARLAALEGEYAAACALREELAQVKARRRAVIEEEARLRAKRQALDAELATLERIERSRRLDEAEHIKARLDEVTQRCFELGAARDFPLERASEFQWAENVARTTRLQRERTEAERVKLQTQLEDEKRKLGPEAARPMAEIPERLELRLSELESEIRRSQERIAECAAAQDAVQNDLRVVQETLASLPDFGSVSGDPVEWLTQLTSSFGLARRACDEEHARLRAIERDIEQRNTDLAAPERVFGPCPGFVEQAREYDVNTRLFEEHLERLASRVEFLRAEAEEFAGERPRFLLMASMLGIGMAFFLILAYLQGKWGILVPAAISAIGLLYFLVNYLYAGARAKHACRQLEDAQKEIGEKRADDDLNRAAMETMMREAGCLTMRELEAMHDRYREAVADRSALEHARAEQAARLAEAEERVSQLLARLRETFRSLGEELEREDDVQHAAGRVMSRYQEYRDAKRRLRACHTALDERTAEHAHVTEQTEALMKAEVAASLEA